MDENKLKKLKEIDYTIQPCCAFCRYGQFTPSGNFGTCARFKYDHLKHTGADRQLSINRYGSCPLHLTDEDKIHSILQSFLQFF